MDCWDFADQMLNPWDMKSLLRLVFGVRFGFAEIDFVEPRRLDMKTAKSSPQLSASFNYFIYFEQITPFY